MSGPTYHPTTMPEVMGDVRNILKSGLVQSGYSSVEIDMKARDSDQILLVVRSGVHQHRLLSRDQARAALNQAQPLMGDLSFWYRFEEICDRILKVGHGHLHVALKPAGRGHSTLTLQGFPSYRFKIRSTDLYG